MFLLILKHIVLPDLILLLFANSFVLVICVRTQVLNKLDEFEDAVRKAVSDVRFDNDVVVSVFETNIRVLGYKPYLT